MNTPAFPLRPAWVEIDLRKVARNFEIINRARPTGVSILSVVKDHAYGHGVEKIVEAALAAGVEYFGVATLDEALAAKKYVRGKPILVMGERTEAELAVAYAEGFTCCISHLETLESIRSLRPTVDRPFRVHVEVDTGMSRYGVRWREAVDFIANLKQTPGIDLEGILSHFAMSDETDKTFATLQLARFRDVLNSLEAKKIPVKLRHFCNSGGFLDLPSAHFEMVRLGLLPLGVYPSAVCKRLEGLEPVMTVKTRIATIQKLQTGDTVGYGMRYTANSPRRIAVLPVGYGDGFPRVRNEGEVLLHGSRVPIVGSVSMDALTVDVTKVAQAARWDEVVLMGRQGEEEITVNEVAKLKNSVSYDVLANWRGRLPRVYLGGA